MEIKKSLNNFFFTQIEERLFIRVKSHITLILKVYMFGEQFQSINFKINFSMILEFIVHFPVRNMGKFYILIPGANVPFYILSVM